MTEQQDQGPDTGEEMRSASVRWSPLSCRVWCVVCWSAVVRVVRCGAVARVGHRAPGDVGHPGVAGLRPVDHVTKKVTLRERACTFREHWLPCPWGRWSGGPDEVSRHSCRAKGRSHGMQGPTARGRTPRRRAAERGTTGGIATTTTNDGADWRDRSCGRFGIGGTCRIRHSRRACCTRGTYRGTSG